MKERASEPSHPLSIASSHLSCSQSDSNQHSNRSTQRREAKEAKFHQSSFPVPKQNLHASTWYISTPTTKAPHSTRNPHFQINTSCKRHPFAVNLPSFAVSLPSLVVSLPSLVVSLSKQSSTTQHLHQEGFSRVHPKKAVCIRHNIRFPRDIVVFKFTIFRIPEQI